MHTRTLLIAGDHAESLAFVDQFTQVPDSVDEAKMTPNTAVAAGGSLVDAARPAAEPGPGRRRRAAIPHPFMKEGP